MNRKISIEYDVEENSMRFTVDASEFRGMSDDDIAQEIQAQVNRDARANISFYPRNVAKTVEAIKGELRAAAQEEAEEDALDADPQYGEVRI